MFSLRFGDLQQVTATPCDMNATSADIDISQNVRGETPIGLGTHVGFAYCTEHQTTNLGVRGSNPFGRAKTSINPRRYQ
jgi:hypothetical protein